MFSKSRLSIAVGAALGISSMTMMPANAQDASANQLEEVIITGSRIARTGVDTPTPVTTLDADSMRISANVSLGTTLLELPQTGNVSGVSDSTSNFTVSAAGISTIDLRNLGPQRTLVLVNGRRHVGGDSENPSAVDLNSIPDAFVERVELITGGASAVYGSDAMAGVINIITKKNFEGFEINGQYGESDENDGENKRIDLTWGSTFEGDRGYAIVNFGYNKVEDIFAKDRGISDECLDDNGKRDNQCYSSFAPKGTILTDTRDLTQAADGSWTKDFDRVEDGFNRGAYRKLQVPLEQKSFAANASYKINEYVNVFGEMSYTQTESDSALEPTITGLFITVGDNDLVLPGDNPFIPQGVIDQFAIEGVNLPDEDVDLYFLKRFTELGPRITEPSRETARMLAGFDGLLKNGWAWETYYQYGQNDQTQNNSNDFNTLYFQQSLQAEADPDNPGGYRCKDALARSLGCVPMDIFGEGSISQEAVDYVRATAINSQKIEQHVAAFSITGDAFELPAGTLNWAAGYEYRKEKLDTRFDALRAAGLSSANATQPVKGDYDVNEVYAEINVPVLESVEIDAAYRYADYSTIGDVDSWKIGANWDIKTLDLRLRSTYSVANRAPNLAELYDPGSETFESFVDPCTDQGVAAGSTTQQNCISVGIPPGYDPGVNGQSAGGLQSGNTNLTEEEAETMTAGFVYQPTWFEGASLTVDYWDIEIKDAVELIDPQVKLQNCYGANNFPDNSFCNGITRGGSEINYVIKRLDFGLENIGKLETNGTDLEFNYITDSSVGTWHGTILGVWTDEFKRTISGIPDDDSEEPGYQEWKWNTRLSWSTGPWQLAWTSRYLGEGIVDPNLEGIIADNKLDSVWYQDLYAAYNLEFQGSQVEFYIGGNNVTDEDAPYVPSESANQTTGTATAAGVFDVIGRYYYAGFRAHF
ncbi:MAG: TonB-dependent receptor [Gammaproteobacteria bacterium]|nr:TonB-dependent receptor [Gammaproteobacteria bacterium]